jgi:hypothetical protein
MLCKKSFMSNDFKSSSIVVYQSTWCTNQCDVRPQYCSSTFYRVETYNPILSGHEHILELGTTKSIKHELVKTCSLGCGTNGFNHIGQYD